MYPISQCPISIAPRVYSSIEWAKSICDCSLKRDSNTGEETPIYFLQKVDIFLMQQAYSSVRSNLIRKQKLPEEIT